MIGRFHEVYVMDWGIAKILGKDGLCDNSESTISGTPEYIAPEIINEQPYGTASDQYSLGVTLYEISTMSRIKTGNTINAVFTRTREGKFNNDAMFSGDNKLPEDLKAIIKKATEGKIHGVAAFDISFSYIHEIMKSENSRKHLVMANYLIDPSGNIISELEKSKGI